MTKGRQSNEIVRAIVGLGKELAIPVVAEGVETEEEMDMLKTMQCQGVQGYLVGRPKPIEHYRHLIDRRPEWEEHEKLTEVRESHICSSPWIGDRKRTLRRELDEEAARMEIADGMATDQQ
jgi:predicted signal transduction protein with EAL and GGDEF domain